MQPIQAPNHANRFAFLDVTRAVAALSVMLQHGLEASGLEGLEPGAVATTWLNLGETGVAIFFLVSGFIIPASMRGTPTFLRFWLRRIFRIYPLYLTIFVAALLVTKYLFDKPLPPLGITIFSHLLIVQPWVGLPNFVGGAWTLLIEMIWYAAFSIAFFSGIGTGKRLIVWFLIAYAIVIAVAAIVFPQFPFGRFSIFALCFYGYAYLLRFEEKIDARTFMAISVTFLLLTLVSLFVGFALYPSGAHGAPTFTCVVISWGLALALFPIAIRLRNVDFCNSPVLRYLGEISYSLYLVHSLVMGIMMYLGVRVFVFLPILLVVTLTVSTLTYRFIERPGIALARRLTQKTSLAQA